MFEANLRALPSYTLTRYRLFGDTVNTSARMVRDKRALEGQHFAVNVDGFSPEVFDPCLHMCFWIRARAFIKQSTHGLT